jgi:endonuclease/exonuclease/phosphatase family metal-dependent hydrolase
VPPFPNPPPHDYDPAVQIAALRSYRDEQPGRQIPQKTADKLLLATWNIANLGLQERTPPDYRLIAEIISWFDLVAVQETNDNLIGLRSIIGQLPPDYKAGFSGPAGNNERMAFLYDAGKVRPLEKVGGLNVPPSQLPKIKVAGVESSFEGFDRNPYMAAFRAGDFTFLLVNVHLYYGGAQPKPIGRRILETFAVARWTDLRRQDPHAYTHNILALGDFNLPKAVEGDPIFDELTSRGLELPPHSTAIGSSITDDEHYDQIAFFPGDVKLNFLQAAVFDFDGAIFRTLWEKAGDEAHKDFFAFVRYHISDHRPLWAEFKTSSLHAPAGPSR